MTRLCPIRVGTARHRSGDGLCSPSDFHGFRCACKRRGRSASDQLLVRIDAPLKRTLAYEAPGQLEGPASGHSHFKAAPLCVCHCAWHFAQLVRSCHPALRQAACVQVSRAAL